jgi:CRISPR/Cas system-associated exonuclease Cas4 (RecB family)
MTTIRTWSYSRLTTFEKCRMWAKLAYIDKIPEPERPLPKGKTEHANDRGNRIHNLAELYVKNPMDMELPEELHTFRPEFEALRALYKDGRVSLEEEWGYDVNWDPCAWMSETVWLRVKLDNMVWLDETTVLVTDYKTGKKFGNEIKHGEQGQLYAIAALLRHPEIEKVTVEFWYLDLNEISCVEYSRKQIMKVMPTFEKRGASMTTCEEFPPSPNIFSCKYCPYGPAGTGHCTKGVCL